MRNLEFEQVWSVSNPQGYGTMFHCVICGKDLEFGNSDVPNHRRKHNILTDEVDNFIIRQRVMR